MRENIILEIKDLEIVFDTQDGIVHALNGVSLCLEEGKTLGLVGETGAGKTTLLSLLAGLDTAVKGTVLCNGEDITKKGLNYHRKHNISLVFQNYNLIDYMTSLENVMLTSKSSPLEFLKDVGITEEEAKRNVLKLSGGQQQRVAIARAVASETPIILADEPTGNLDEKTSDEIVDLLRKQVRDKSKTVIIVTHSKEIALAADFVYKIENGSLVRADMTRT